MIQICPYCRAEQTVPIEYLNKKVKCKDCLKAYLVSDQWEPPPEQPKPEPPKPVAPPQYEPRLQGISIQDGRYFDFGFRFAMGFWFGTFILSLLAGILYLVVTFLLLVFFAILNKV